MGRIYFDQKISKKLQTIIPCLWETRTTVYKKITWQNPGACWFFTKPYLWRIGRTIWLPERYRHWILQHRWWWLFIAKDQFSKTFKNRTIFSLSHCLDLLWSPFCTSIQILARCTGFHHYTWRDNYWRWWINAEKPYPKFCVK